MQTIHDHYIYYIYYLLYTFNIRYGCLPLYYVPQSHVKRTVETTWAVVGKQSTIIYLDAATTRSTTDRFRSA